MHAAPVLTATQTGSGAGIWLDGGAGVIDPWLLANVFSTPHVSSLFWVATFWPISGITWHRFGSTTLGLDSLSYPCNSAKKHHSCFDALPGSCETCFVLQFLLSYFWIHQGKLLWCTPLKQRGPQPSSTVRSTSIATHWLSKYKMIDPHLVD